MTRIAQSNSFGVLAAAALFCGAAVSQAQATTLDKLIGTSLTVGNLIFSDFSAPSFVGASPGNIDVQGVVVTDPDTGKQQTGLRFAIVPALSLSPNGGANEIALWVDYSVTNTTGQTNIVAPSVIASVTDQAGVMFTTTSSPLQDVAQASLGDPTLTYAQYCNWFGALCVNQLISASPTGFAVAISGNQSVAAPLYPGTALFHVQHQVNLRISDRNGVPGGSATLQEFNAFFSE